MKLVRIRMIVLAAIVTGLVFAGASYAQQIDEGQDQPYRGKADEVLKKLNLSAQQEVKIKEFQDINRGKTKELRLNLKEKRKELMEELIKPISDKAGIKFLTRDLKDIEGRLIEHRVNGVIQMKEVLAPEQYRTFSDTLKNMRKEDFGRKRRR
ncbi:MAG: hypothetical protein PHU96_00895 [Candidatus Omnitrophica bacterium]|nr:hypothetical protein [Candidatus Omnitrophota bacterium]